MKYSIEKIFIHSGNRDVFWENPDVYCGQAGY
jgi:hypothetical protein